MRPKSCPGVDTTSGTRTATERLAGKTVNAESFPAKASGMRQKMGERFAAVSAAKLFPIHRQPVRGVA